MILFLQKQKKLKTEEEKIKVGKKHGKQGNLNIYKKFFERFLKVGTPIALIISEQKKFGNAKEKFKNQEE